MIERDIFIRAPRARVWQALTDAKQFAAWFEVKMDGNFAPGARVEMVSLGNGCEGQKFFVEVVQMDAPKFFAWRWHPGSNPQGEDRSHEPMSTVEFRMEEAEGGTRLEVKEYGFDQLSLMRRTQAFKDNDGGWRVMLGRIESYVGEAA